MTEQQWQFSPARLRGHRERLHLTRPQYSMISGFSVATVKSAEYGKHVPGLVFFLSAAGLLGISPNELCRIHEDDGVEYLDALHWTPQQQMTRSQP